MSAQSSTLHSSTQHPSPAIFHQSRPRIVKDFTLKGEGHHLDLFTDIFNIAGSQNRNFGPSTVSLFGDTAHPVYSSGTPLFAPGVTRRGGPRQIQFTARLVGF